MRCILTLLSLFILWGAAASTPDFKFIPADNSQVRFVGRTLVANDGSVSFDWSGTYFSFQFHGRSCAVRISDTKRNYYNIFVDGILTDTITTTGIEPSLVVLAEKLACGEHHVRVQKRTEGEQGRTTVHAVGVDGQFLSPPVALGRHIEFIGDSHTCGYGTEGLSAKEPFTPETENCELAWGCILARYFEADYTLIAHSGQGIARNWGDKQERSNVTMRERMLRTFDMDTTYKWDFGRLRPDVVVVKLGTNDFSTNVKPSQETFNNSYAQLLAQLRAAYGTVPVLCVAPQSVPEIRAYLEVFVAQSKDKQLFWAAMNDSVNNWGSDMGANFHPNLTGHRKMAMSIAPYISTIMGWDLPLKVIQ